MKHCRFWFLLLISLTSIASNATVCIFDLGGILVEKSGFASAWNIGLHHFVGFYNPYKLHNKMFEFFNTIEARKPETPWAYNDNILLPQLMCDWMMGNRTSSEIRNIIEKALTEKKHAFSKKKYQKLTKYITDFMFTPERLAGGMRPLKQGVELLKLCKKKQHSIYILSNWDPESFQELCKLPWFKNILSMCDGCVISGVARMMKPDPRIFEHLFKLYDIDPDTTLTVYIDDSHENILGAQTLNKKKLVCLECQNKKFEPIKAELTRLAIL